MKFFNSDKSGFLSFVAKRMKALFALFFIIAGTSSVWGQNPELSWTYASDMSGWADAVGKSEYTFIRQDVVFAGNNYTHYLDIEFQSAGTDNYKLIEDGKNWYGMETTIPYQCKWWEWKSGAGNTAFQHNAGKYRFYINANPDQRKITVTGIFVTIEDEPVNNGDGTYTITGHYTNANPSQQNIHEYLIFFSEGVGHGVGANETATTVGEDGSFSITKQLDEGQQYTCCARVIDGSIGDHDSKYITFTAQAATPEPEPTVTDLYIFGVDNNWSNPSDEWKCTSVSQDGNVYTWNWSSAPKTFNGSTYFKVGAKNATNTGIDDNNNYGPSGSDVTLVFNGVQSIVQTVVNSSASKAFTVSAATEISQIVFDKAALTVTFYAPVETEDPVYAATITADASASQQTARQVVLTSSLTETSASTDLSAATCQFQYLSADAAEGTEYSNLDAPVAYNADGVSLTTTALPQGGKYLFRAVWTLNGEVVATSEPSEATCVYPVWPEPEMFDVVWIPTYNTSDGSVTITAEISAKEDAGFVMGQIVGLVVNIFVDEASQVTTLDNPSGAENNTATATATIQNVNEGQELTYRLEFTTGASAQVLGRGGIQIPGGTYVVEAPEVHNSTVYLRGDINGWAYEDIEDKFIGKTYDDVNVFWDWSGSLVEFVTTGESGGSKFKFDDTTDGAWGDGQWNNGSSDAWIGEEQISDNKATFTAIKGNPGDLGNFWILPNICPATISRIDLNVETNQLVITFDSYKKEFKDLWFRCPIVEGGWGDGISDPLAYGVNPKYQGQTSDGVVYVWDWSGSNAVTIEAGTNFKFGEYTGNASWGNTAYGGLNAEDRNFTSADFGKQLKTITAAGYEFSPAEKVTITGVTLDTENMTVVFAGEAYVERFPVTVNTVNGEAGGAIVTEPADIGNMSIGETITVTATANEGYVALFEATSGCVMTDGSADNIKVFEITAANPVITVTFQVQCETVEPGFAISGQFNVGFEDDAVQYAGSVIQSGEADPADGIWADGARYIQLTANSVTANYFEWECTGYAIDGAAQEAVPEISWTYKDKTSARADLSLPGTYTFVCKAKCNETDEWTNSAELTITAPVPAMGFDGPGFVGSTWDHPSAGREGEGLMTRQNGGLVWKSRVLNVAGFGAGNEFVIIQQYKRVGCTPNSGWNGYNEEDCVTATGGTDANKINSSDLTFTNVQWAGDAKGGNLLPLNGGNWTAGKNGTPLQLVVTMTGTDSYTVALEEVSQECTTPADNFAISAQLNKGAGAPFEGNLVASGSNTKTGGYFADDFRTVTLTTTQVADTYEWKLVGYAIDGIAQATADLTTLATITNDEAQTATALLSRPGDYTFQCTAACTDGTPVNSATVTISTYPEIGFDGPIGTPANLTTENNGWNHAWAGQQGNGLLVRENASLKWSLNFVYQGVGSTPNDFVVIQRYKRGCVTAPAGGEQGWAGFTECGAIVPGEPDFWGNKINASVIDLASGLGYASTTEGDNFRADDLATEHGWVAGVTELTLTVSMTGWDSYTVELSKKQEQIFANYSSNDANMGTVTMKVGDTQINNGDDITAYIGQQVTLTASPAPGYKVASWKINDKVTESDRITITPTLSGDGLEVLVTFERDCYAGVAYDLTGGGVICANGGSTELSLNTLNNVTYQLYRNGAPYGEAVQGNGEAAKWTISEAGTYTAMAYDSRFVEECQEQAIDMNGSAVVKTVTAPEITVNPGDNVHLTVLQARSFTADVPVDWSIRSIPADTGGTYCDGDGYMISSQTDTSLVAKFLCVGTAKITATMKDPNQNCMAEVTVTQNMAENENCAPEPEDMQ